MLSIPRASTAAGIQARYQAPFLALKHRPPRHKTLTDEWQPSWGRRLADGVFVALPGPQHSHALRVRHGLVRPDGLLPDAERL
jgi:hypothetical protein